MDTLNINDTMSIINYGVNVQNMISDLSDCAFGVIKKIDLSNISTLLSDMLDYFKSDSSKKLSFSEKEKEVDDMTDKLREYRVNLLMECELLEQLCNVNREYIAEIIKLIENARNICEEMREQNLSGDMRIRLGTLEKRIRELEMSQTVAYSFEPQLKVVEENAAQMAEKIQSALVNVLALWKRQQVTEKNNQSISDTNALIMEGINELIRLQREGYSLVDKS